MKIGSSRLIKDTCNLIKLPLNKDKIKDLIITDSNGSTVKDRGALLVKLAASHWGFINQNGFWYDPKTVDGTSPTWTQPYNKPVLGYHPKTDDDAAIPLGRILNAKYLKGVARQFVNDELIPDNVPDGHYEFLTRIPDEMAAKRVVNGIYDTVSISAIATNVICSICGEAAVDGNTEHEHKRFHWYEQEDVEDSVKVIQSKKGSLCYYLAGPLAGRHVAFVLTPSDQYAGVKEFEYESSITDNTNETAEMELYVLSDSGKLFLSLNDDKSDNMYETLRDELKIKDAGKVIIDMITSIEKSSSEYVNKLNKMGNESSEKTMADKKSGNKLVTDNLQDLLSTDGKLSLDLLVLLEEVEIDEILASGDDVVTEDAKLTASQRKGLSDKTFCGPGRSFPVPDKAHVTAALRLINRSKYSGSTKASILSCVRGKARKFGMEVSSKTKDSNGEIVIEEIIVNDILLSNATIDDILALETVEKYISDNYVKVETADSDTSNNKGDEQMEEEKKEDKTETVNTDDKKEDIKPADGSTTDVKPEDKVEDKVEVVEVKTDDKVSVPGESGADADTKTADAVINDEIKNLTLNNAELYKELKSGVIDRIVDHRLFLRKITKEQIEDSKKELMTRSMDSLKDTLKDILVEDEAFTPSEKPESKQINGGKQTDKKVDWMDEIPTRGKDALKDIFPWADKD